MPFFRSSRAAYLLGLLLAICLPPNFLASGAATVDERKPPMSKEEWRAAMLNVPRAKGCFHAAYPNLTWLPLACKPAPKRPYNVGHGNDFSAKVGGLLTTVIGSFDAVNGVTSETGAGNVANSYSLQLNSSFFTSTTACASAEIPANCQGWAQFIYSNEGSLFIEFWLIHWGNVPCPAGWTSQPPSCLINTPATPVPVQPISNLASLSLIGTASGALDGVTLSTGSDIYVSSGDDTLTNLSQGWNYAEFNVFGDGGGATASFNPGSNIIVRTAVTDGTMNQPTCSGDGNSIETNNLNLVAPCCPYGGAAPAIVFDESNNPGATAMCANGTSIGDTHLTNVNNVLYDFQASGDFLLAETNPGFVVQTRQRSGAPTWPNATVNKAVAVRMGTTRAAFCLAPDRLIVDGKPVVLGDGKTLALPGGDSIAHNGDTYLFARKSGENVSAQIASAYINVTVGVGHPSVALVRGLLGNVNGNTGPKDLAARGRAVLHQPPSLADLYHGYGDSWRVEGTESMSAQLCGDKDVERANPAKPFYASDLDAKTRGRSQAICAAAGVKEGPLLEACTLDVAVLGDKGAARAFVRAAPPRAVIRVGDKR